MSSEILEIRRNQWRLSPKIKNRIINIDRHPEWEATCCHPHCMNRRNLRQTPFGDYCEKHFFQAPTCSSPGCTNPVTVDEFNPGGLCRECWNGILVDRDQDTWEYATQGHSMISRCAI